MGRKARPEREQKIGLEQVPTKVTAILEPISQSFRVSPAPSDHQACVEACCSWEFSRGTGISPTMLAAGGRLAHASPLWDELHTCFSSRRAFPDTSALLLPPQDLPALARLMPALCPVQQVQAVQAVSHVQQPAPLPGRSSPGQLSASLQQKTGSFTACFLLSGGLCLNRASQAWLACEGCRRQEGGTTS